MTKITEKFLNGFPKGTNVSIDTNVSGKPENIDALIKNDDKYWVSIYGGKAMTVSNLSKYLRQFLEDSNVSVQINPNQHSDGDEPIYIFVNGEDWTINNTKFLGARSTKAPHKTHKKSNGLASLQNSYKKML